MSKYMRAALMVAVGVALVATAAFASVPDPLYSSCTCIAYGPSGFNAVVVTVMSGPVTPVVGSNVQIDFGTNYTANTTPGVIFCPSPGVNIVRTNGVLSGGTYLGAGQYEFKIKGSRCANAGVVRVYADGIQICSFAHAASVDFDGDGQVSVSDLGNWAGTQASQDPCGDYNCDGSVNVADLGIWAAGQAGGGC
jgi:hypothetical protein